MKVISKMKSWVVMVGLLSLTMVLCGCGNSNAILVVHLNSDERSDAVQIENAVDKGGQLSLDKESIPVMDEIGPDVEGYGALNSQGSYYVNGAILNWVADKGWRLVAVNLNSYYFVRVR